MVSTRMLFALIMCLSMLSLTQAQQSAPPDFQWNHANIAANVEDVAVATYTPPGHASTLFVAYKYKVRGQPRLAWMSNDGSGFEHPSPIPATVHVKDHTSPILMVADDQLFCFFAAAGALAWSIYDPVLHDWLLASTVTLNEVINTAFSGTVTKDALGRTSLFFTWHSGRQGYPSIRQLSIPLADLQHNPPIIGNSEGIYTQSGQFFLSKTDSAVFVVGDTLYVVTSNGDGSYGNGDIVLYNDAHNPVHDQWLVYSIDPCNGPSSWQVNPFSVGRCSNFLVVTHVVGGYWSEPGPVLFNIFVSQVSGWLGDYNIVVDGNNILARGAAKTVIWNNQLYVFYRHPSGHLAAVKTNL